MKYGTNASASKYRKVAISLRLDGPSYDALERWRGTHGGLSQALAIKNALHQLEGYPAILKAEQEAYDKELNHKNRKLDVLVSKIKQDNISA